MTTATPKTQLDIDREAWLTEAAQFIQDDLIAPELRGHSIPHPFRVSVGYAPRTTARSKVVAVCIRAEASADLHNEIFVSPVHSNSLDILASLAHEMVHQADNCASGHKGFFARVARAIGLEGNPTSTEASADLNAYFLREIIATLGEIPHAKIDLSIAKPKQSTRMIKVECQSCGFVFRTSRKWADAIKTDYCNCCGAEGNGLYIHDDI